MLLATIPEYSSDKDKENDSSSIPTSDESSLEAFLGLK